jgi:diphthine-ammonia ligase
VCGEGGEYESAVFDCPLFKTHRIEIERAEVVVTDPNEYAKVCFLKLEALKIAEKESETIERHEEILKSMKKELTIDLEELKIESYKSGLKAPAKLSPESSLFYSGVIFASSLHGEFADAESKFEALLDKHEQLLYASEMSLKGNAIAVSLYIPDMTKFVPLNKRYAARFGLRPPVRVCVQLTTNDDIGMGVIAAPTGTKIINVHVQSFSTWAPANIGPYS